jgi:hypothetical protein
VSVHGYPRLHFEPLKLLNFYFTADPDSAYGKDPDPRIRSPGLRIRIILLSSVVFQDVNQKNKFSSLIFSLITYRTVHLHQSSKISNKEVTKLPIQNKFFLKFCCLLMERAGARTGSVQIITDPDPGGRKTWGSYGPGSGTRLYGLFFGIESCLR